LEEYTGGAHNFSAGDTPLLGHWGPQVEWGGEFKHGRMALLRGKNKIGRLENAEGKIPIYSAGKS